MSQTDMQICPNMFQRFTQKLQKHPRSVRQLHWLPDRGTPVRTRYLDSALASELCHTIVCFSKLEAYGAAPLSTDCRHLGK